MDDTHLGFETLSKVIVLRIADRNPPRGDERALNREPVRTGIARCIYNT